MTCIFMYMPLIKKNFQYTIYKKYDTYIVLKIDIRKLKKKTDCEFSIKNNVHPERYYRYYVTKYNNKMLKGNVTK